MSTALCTKEHLHHWCVELLLLMEVVLSLRWYAAEKEIFVCEMQHKSNSTCIHHGQYVVLSMPTCRYAIYTSYNIIV